MGKVLMFKGADFSEHAIDKIVIDDKTEVGDLTVAAYRNVGQYSPWSVGHPYRRDTQMLWGLLNKDLSGKTITISLASNDSHLRFGGWVLPNTAASLQPEDIGITDQINANDWISNGLATRKLKPNVTGDQDANDVIITLEGTEKTICLVCSSNNGSAIDKNIIVKIISKE